jgi:hypothetical protein
VNEEVNPFIKAIEVIKFSATLPYLNHSRVFAYWGLVEPKQWTTETFDNSESRGGIESLIE